MGSKKKFHKTNNILDPMKQFFFFSNQSKMLYDANNLLRAKSAEPIAFALSCNSERTISALGYIKFKV